ncbi:hypothetical protein HK096_004978, partial [Nowakowskiella sp. JEL0078]
MSFTPKLDNIIGGVVVNPGSFPNIAYVEILESNGKTQSSFLCSGTFIGTTTTAHCVTPGTGYEVTNVAALSFFTNKTGTYSRLHTGITAITASNWNPNTLVGDVALVFLSPKTPYTGATIPINVKYSQSKLAGLLTTSCGFGAQVNTIDDPNGTTAGTSLSCVNATISANVSACASSISSTRTSLCVDFPTGSTVCHGDSGGPLWLKDPATNGSIQVGLTSYGQENCLENAAYFTDIFQYSSQIVNAMCKNSDGNCQNLLSILAKDAP